MNWTEKYRPQSLKGVVGNRAAKESLFRWAEGWKRGKPGKKAVILYGRAGVGKTTAAHALARDFGWEVIELNASDERNRERIQRIALTGAVNEVLSIDGEFISSKEGARRLIILDEADNLYEKAGDYGGKRAIIDAIKAARQPVILIANDYYALVKGNGAELKTLCQSIPFKKVAVPEIAKLLRTIARLEGIRGDLTVIDIIAGMCDGDVRSAINDLQSISHEKRLDKTMLSRIGYRDRVQEIFSGVRSILKARNMRIAIKEARQLDESPETLILWIDENVPLEYQNSDDRKRAYEFLSRASVFLGRTWRRQYYGLWRYAHELMTGGVAVAKMHEYRGFTQYNFPRWLRKMSASKYQRYMQMQIAQKMGSHMHCSGKKAFAMLPWMKKLFKNEDFAARMAASMELSENELSLLVDERAKDIYREGMELKKRDKQSVLFDFK
ncbi:MAG: replication factor C large subunit [Thermoplasmata archaeon]|nr:MAG: replication factor C large subunit [Thermoplasmata archaeon]RLF58179.1 MAG: replication factor C large subunit [Thermoplasmata archaeon]